MKRNRKAAIRTQDVFMTWDAKFRVGDRVRSKEMEGVVRRVVKIHDRWAINVEDLDGFYRATRYESSFTLIERPGLTGMEGASDEYDEMMRVEEIMEEL